MIDSTDNRHKVKRGSDLPWARLDESDVRLILQIVEDREALKRQLAELTNAKLAEKWGVHVRTIDRVTAGETWGHVVIGYAA